MRDLKHLIYFEDLLQEANNDLVRKGKEDGNLCLGYTCYFMPEVLLDLPGCFSVRLRAPKCTSPDMATYYMSGRTCHYGRSLLERALEGGYNFIDAQLATETCTVTCRFQEHLDYMDESHPLNPAREQGIFIHSCLEELAKLPAAARDVDLVLSRNFRKKPWLNEVPYSPGRGAAPVPFRGQAEEEISWFLSLPGAGDWMDRGLAEQNLLRGGANPQMLRADLIVPDPDGALVIDYKHGSREVLSPEVERKYEAKMRLYLKSLGDTGLKRPLAVLCYLTRRECCVVNAAGATLKTDAQGLTAAIAAMRERANV